MFNRPFLLLLVVVSLFGLGCVDDKMVRDGAEQTHTQLQAAVVDDAQVNTYLQQVGDRILAAARQIDQARPKGKLSFLDSDNSWMFSDNIKFHLVNIEKVNAVTTGGDHMYIYKGFFEECQSEDELAAVMSHEFAHIYLRHIQNKETVAMYGQSIMQGIADAGKQAAARGDYRGANNIGVFGGMADIVRIVFGQGYSRNEEGEADKMGLAFYTQAGWDPQKFAELFQNQLDRVGVQADHQSLLADHPTLSQRITAINQQVSLLPPDTANRRKPPIATILGFRVLQKRATEVAKTSPSPAFDQAVESLGAFSCCFSDDQKPLTAHPSSATVASFQQVGYPVASTPRRISGVPTR